MKVTTGVFLGALCACLSVTHAQQIPTYAMPLVNEQRQQVQPGTLPDALTAGEKAELMVKNTFGPKTVLNRVFWAGINHWNERPEEWGSGWDAFGQRFANRYGRTMVRNSIMLGVNIATKTDPRYDRCLCDGFLPRTKHALSRVVTARKDSGGVTFNYARVTGAFVTPMIANNWYPDRMNTWDYKMKSSVSYLGWRGAGNIIREFWPEMKSKLRFLPGD